MEELQSLILSTLDKENTIPDTGKLTNAEGKQPDQLALYAALNSLALKEMIVYDALESEIWTLTAEGKEMANTGSYEVKVFEAIPSGETGISISELQGLLGEAAKIGQGKAFKNKWITKKDNRLFRAVESVVDQTRLDLEAISTTKTHPDKKVLAELKRRKLCDKIKLVSYSVSKGPKFSLTIENGEWKSAQFKKYNFDALGVPPSGGHLHPLMKVREEFRQIFLEMGFEEMPTNRFVESSFWNFDALFQPQQHPARDAHDTFFLKDPARSTKFPAGYLERVKRVHSVGGYGSIGYGYDWQIAEAEKLILRTHTTAVSSAMLYKLANQEEFRPAKYFSIDRVFRNESVDATHLAEFHQIEGVIADKGLTLGDLIGFMNTFFGKMGVKDLRFKPAYNPYTEPSMEIFSYHYGLKKWVEIGNSGMFRPEMLEPMGLDPDVRVIAWGLGLERPTMIKYGIDNIRELLGHKVNLAMIQIH
ncbi:295_t:CDS:10 [Paraglomus brasilianum]|uniref:phenylalanine--tRNA ligase n=1 Tax=Paraglomus brasilianum TaxID=144538 RepID=A0A9N8ZIU7_9GLOM|nr:295_t:CDS:10 [Paraglomus brasilianum]